jgi:hypothetical protein
MDALEEVPCKCHDLPDIIKVRDEAGFEARLECLEICGWDMLCRCVVCGELWKMDGVDKYQIQFAVRIHDPSQWQTFNDTALRKAYLVVSRGGLTDEKCIWAGCDEPRVNGVVMCVDHLYDTGARQ